MIANYLIGLREGLEAALVVSILVAYLVKVGRRDRVRGVSGGVALAVAVSIAFGALLTFTSTQLLSDFRSQELFGGSMSVLAVVFVTWMVFWMRRTARGMRAELDGRMSSALELGTAAVALTAFLAVAREGLETALFFWSAVQAAGSTTLPVAGFALGIATAVALAWLLYRRSVRLNLARFFTWTGAGLIVIAAGVLSYAVHDLQEGGALAGLDRLAFDVSQVISPGSWPATLLKGTVNFTPRTTVAQAIAWCAYIVPVMAVFLLGGGQPALRRTRTLQLPQPPSAACYLIPILAVAVAVSAGCSSTTSTASTPSTVSTGGTGAGARTGPVAVTAGERTCEVARTELPAGQHTFQVTNTASQVTEVYVYAAGDRIMGEVENVGPSTRRSLIVDLPAGAYQIACKPGMVGNGNRTAVTVTGTVASVQSQDANLRAAVDSYRSYVESEALALVDTTATLVNALDAGDLAAAGRAYPAARLHYERIEPIAESFGDLDPLIDMRIDDATGGTPFVGFHALERLMYQRKTLRGTRPLAAALRRNLAKLQTLVRTVIFTPLVMGNGAKSLLDEVAKSKVTGEEERYSRIDLVDFAGNVDGAKYVYTALRPALQAKDADLVSTLDRRFPALVQLLESHRAAPGDRGYVPGSPFVSYDALTKDQVRALAVQVDALSEPLGRISGAVTRG